MSAARARLSRQQAISIAAKIPFRWFPVSVNDNVNAIADALMRVDTEARAGCIPCDQCGMGGACAFSSPDAQQRELDPLYQDESGK
jgi:hypothetical protein